MRDVMKASTNLTECIDILKYAVSLQGVSLYYLLRSSIERGAELCSPCNDRLVFTRYHEAGVTRIKLHCLTKPKVWL